MVSIRWNTTASALRTSGVESTCRVAVGILLDDGAVSVVLEPEVIVEQRARAFAQEVARAPTLEDKVEALWRSKGFDPGDRREPLMAKLSLLQGGRA